MGNMTLTAVSGILVGHAVDAYGSTGCTAVLCPEGFTPGIAVPGFAPGCRETELMRPESLVDSVHGLLLSGGSAFGLAAADGVVRFLRERGHGYAMPHGAVPIVPGAVIYDLDGNRSPGVLPDAAMGYAAASAASKEAVEQGRVGAGAGARCGRLFALSKGTAAMGAGGIGSMVCEYRGIQVAALVVVNALGNVHDPDSGAFLAGGRDAAGKPLDRDALLKALAGGDARPGNTVLSVVATNAPLDKAGTTRLARMAAAGLARSIMPAHLCHDGDIVFALSAKQPVPATAGPWTESLLGALGAEAVARAVAHAVTDRL